MDRKERQFRIEKLKNRIKKENQLMTLFEECIEILGEDTRIYSSEESVRIVAQMVFIFPFTIWGRVEWNSISCKKSIKNLMELSVVSDLDIDNEFYIVWDELNLPVIETKLKNVIEREDDVKAVGFNTWIVNFETNTIIEVHHDGEINIGIIKSYSSECFEEATSTNTIFMHRGIRPSVRQEILAGELGQPNTLDFVGRREYTKRLN